MSKYVLPEDFIEKWLEAASLGKGTGYISRELGISRERVRQRACYLRRYGVELPYLMGGRQNRKYQIDRSAWNDKIKSFLDESGLQDSQYVAPEGL